MLRDIADIVLHWAPAHIPHISALCKFKWPEASVVAKQHQIPVKSLHFGQVGAFLGGCESYMAFTPLMYKKAERTDICHGGNQADP